MTESSAAALHQLGEDYCKKDHFPGHSQLPEVAPPNPWCEPKSRRHNVAAYQMKWKCVNYPKHDILPLIIILRVPHSLLYFLALMYITQPV